MPNLLCHYQYDPLDRLIGSNQSAHSNRQYFYQENRLTSQLHEKLPASIFRYGNLPLAQKNTSPPTTTLLINDNHNSTLHTVNPDIIKTFSYNCYGYNAQLSNPSCLLEFNGEHRDLFTKHYTLGNGRRAYNPVLMRFNTPDDLSPFDMGGLNTYAYCLNDPINAQDPTGQYSVFMRHFYATIGNKIIKSKNPLNNVKAGALANENIIKGKLISKNKATFTTITKKSDLDILKNKDLNHDYILTNNNELIIGSTPKNLSMDKRLSHASIAHHAQTDYNFSPNVVSAGSLTLGEHGITVSNQSGHYLTPSDRMKPVVYKLRSLNSIAHSTKKIRQ